MKKQIINDASRIEHFLTRLRLESRKVIVRSDLVETQGMITENDSTSIHIMYQGKFTPNRESVNFQFMIEGSYYFAFVPVYKNDGRTITIGIPDFLENRSIRKYPRTYVNDEVYCRFNIIADVSLEREINTASAPPKLATIYFELQKNVPDIKKVLAMVGAEIKKISMKSEIKLHKEGDNFPEEISLVKKHKLPFWIMDTANPKNYIKEIPTADIINYNQYFKEKMKEGWQESKIREELVKREAKYKKQGLGSVIVCPVKLFDNVIGHISVITLSQDTRKLRTNDVYYVNALADIISEALAKAKLFKLDTGTDYEIPVINISAGGAYLEVNSQYIIKFLHEMMHLKASFKFSGKIVDAICEIRRIDFIGETVRLATKFIEISTQDQDFLEEYVKNHIAFTKTQKGMRS